MIPVVHCKGKCCSCNSLLKARVMIWDTFLDDTLSSSLLIPSNVLSLSFFSRLIPIEPPGL